MAPLIKQTAVIEIVNQIIGRKNKNICFDNKTLEANIDEIIYELYGLSEEEIAIVEESVES